MKHTNTRIRPSPNVGILLTLILVLACWPAAAGAPTAPEAHWQGRWQIETHGGGSGFLAIESVEKNTETGRYNLDISIHSPLSQQDERWLAEVDMPGQRLARLRKYRTLASGAQELLVDIVDDPAMNLRREYHHSPGQRDQPTNSVLLERPNGPCAWQADLGLWFLIFLPLLPGNFAPFELYHSSLSTSLVPCRIAPGAGDNRLEIRGIGLLSSWLNHSNALLEPQADDPALVTVGQLDIAFSTNWTMPKLRLVKVSPKESLQ